MQSPSSSTSTATTTKTTAGSNKMLNPSKTSSLKTKSTTVLQLGHPTAAAKDLETSLEIEKISKKISEHADALYRTWKSHGLAPTEILELYTVEAGVAAGAIVDDKSTEDLQKLVNTFVNKDKEQRGVKTGVTKTKSGTAKTEGPTPKVIEHKIQTATHKLATPSANNSSPIVKGNIGAGGNLSSTSLMSGTSNLKGNIMIETPQQHNTTAIKKSTPSIKSTSFLKKNSPSHDTTDSGATTKVTKLKTTKQGIGGTAAAGINDNSTKIQPNKQLDIDFNINMDLDVHKLSLQQTDNLQKIKQLLQEPTSAAAASNNNSTKIPSTQEKTAGKLKEVKLKKSAGVIENSKKFINLEENKQNEELVQPLQRKLNTTDTTGTTTAATSKKIGTKLKTAEQQLNNTIKAHDFGNLNQNQSIETNTAATTTIKKPTKIQDNRDNQQILTTTTNSTISSSGSGSNPQLTKKRTTLTAAGGNISNISSAGSSIISTNNNSNSTIGNTIINAVTTNGNVTIDKEPIEEVALLNNVGNFAQNNKENSIKLQKSTTKSTKTTKLKEKSAKDTPISKILDSKEVTVPTSTASNSALQQLPTSSSSSSAAGEKEESQNMNIQSSDSSTTIMPTPTKLKATRPLSNGNGQEKTLRSPFLTRGSVAERVLIFEKCPDVRNSFLNIKRPDKDAPPKSLMSVKLHSTPPPPPPDQTLLQREVIKNRSVYIPRFYFPHGKPQPQIAVERTLRGILSAFDSFPNNQVTKDELPRVLKICGLPFYWRMPVMVCCQQGNSGLVERQKYIDFWKQMNVYCHDNASRFVYILSRGQRLRSHILPEDLAPLVQDVVDTHPGLAFLKEATEFHSRYVHTVIARIFYSVNRSWSGKITIAELKKSDLLQILILLEEEDDINQIMAFFSYEHFYVIYCKFWELDKDHDLLINQDDLARHSDHALSTRIVERIFSGCVTRSDNKKNEDDEPKMSYADFVWFLLSEEDKRTPTSIEYWFRCMDVDGDGVLSMYELEYFYEEQQQRMESIGIESLPFEDCLCQMLDMIKPKRRDAITLGDLKNCKMTHVFFDTFFNLEKYLDHEQKDPFASQRDEYVTDWERFAAQEYELLITEE